MKLEVPECKRCCCCIPLRYGLLFWVYVKLIASLILLGMLLFTALFEILMIQHNSADRDESFNELVAIRYHVWDIMVLVFVILVALLEISMDITFIVGGHKKNPRLMKVFYYYNIVALCLYILTFIVTFILETIHESLRHSASTPRMVFYLKLQLAGALINTVLQIYLILLIRSEVRKLLNQSTFHFKNNAAEAECNMEVQDGDITTYPDGNLDKMAKIHNEKGDVIKNNKINREEDEKLKLNKYEVIKNVDIE